MVDLLMNYVVSPLLVCAGSFGSQAQWLHDVVTMSESKYAE